jgi:hypothetical protein
MVDLNRDAPRIVRVHCTDDFLVASMSDGRTVSAPLDWYPGVRAGNAAERSNARLIHQGEGILWPDLGQVLSAETLLSGRHPRTTLTELRSF